LRQEATPCPDPPISAQLTEDPDDDYLAALAQDAGAEYLVTGDRALRRWASGTVHVVTPAEFMGRIET
jgi:predicted nucleic acid-binding protein